MTLSMAAILILFLSTLSLRRATVEEVSGDTWARDFYPRSPCGERPSRRSPAIPGPGISIHALLAESDFFPTLEGRKKQISIHALLAESDPNLSSMSERL